MKICLMSWGVAACARDEVGNSIMNVVPMRPMVHTFWLVDSDEREKSVASVPMPGKKSKKMADLMEGYGEFSQGYVPLVTGK